MYMLLIKSHFYDGNLESSYPAFYASLPLLKSKIQSIVAYTEERFDFLLFEKDENGEFVRQEEDPKYPRVYLLVVKLNDEINEFDLSEVCYDPKRIWEEPHEEERFIFGGTFDEFKAWCRDDANVYDILTLLLHANKYPVDVIRALKTYLLE
jgi:hypothetical protein